MWPFDTTFLSDSNWILIDTIHHPHNQWQVGRPRKAIFSSALSFPNALVTDTMRPVRPNDTSVVIIKIPWLFHINFYNLALNFFSLQYQVNSDSGDVASMDFSMDTGLTWHNMISDTGGWLPPAAPVPDLSTATAGWKTLYLYPYYSSWYYAVFPIQSIYIRFTYISDSSSISRDGWMVDNILLGYQGSGVPELNATDSIRVFPNPANSALTIAAPGSMNLIEVRNNLGQLVDCREINAQNVTIDISKFPQGIYFVRINGQVTKEFRKE